MTKCKVAQSTIFFLFACVSTISPHNATAETFFNHPEVISSIGQLNIADIHVNNIVYLDKDEFYLPTARGAFLWNAVTNVLVPVSDSINEKLSKFRTPGVALAGGRIFEFNQNTIVWWNRDAKFLSKPLPSRNQSIGGQVNLDNEHALICSGNKYDDKQNRSDVVSLSRHDNIDELTWDTTPSLRPLLVRAGVIGTVEGFSQISREEITLPVVFNANTCFWELKNPVYIYADGEKLSSTDVVPYFLPDGRILAFVQNHQAPKFMNQPLLWNSKNSRWERMEPAFINSDYKLNSVEMWLNDGGAIVAYDFEQPFIEFLDTKSLRWIRSKQISPKNMAYLRAYPLSNGKTLVMDTLYPRFFAFFEPLRDVPQGELQYPHYSVIVLHDGSIFLPGIRSEMIDANTRISKVKKALERKYDDPALVEMSDGSVLLYAAKTSRCSLFANPAACPNSLRYYPKQDRWEAVPDLNVPYQSASLLRKNGDLIYLVTDADASTLYRWQPGKLASPFAKLLQVRQKAKLLELIDGRLVALSGETASLQVAMEKSCDDCADDMASAGEVGPSRSTEIFDDASGAWSPGPIANYPSGEVVKLQNGRVFKLSQTKPYEDSSSRAEIADAAFTRWNRLPTLPVSFKKIYCVKAIGNRVLIFGNLADKSQQVSMGGGLFHLESVQENLGLVWDDDIQQWKSWNNSNAEFGLWKEHYTLWPMPDGKQAFVYGDGYRIVSMPNALP